MMHLNFFNGKKYLLNLIGLRFTLVVLNINTRVSGPWRFIDTMATTALAWFAEIMRTDLLKVIETNPFRVCFHFRYDLSYAIHWLKISLMILLSSVLFKHNIASNRQTEVVFELCNNL